MEEIIMNNNKGMLIKRLILVLVSLTLLLPSAYADEFQEGIYAGIRGDYKTALEKLMPLAEKGNAKAQRNIGFMYHQGHGVKKNYNEALKWYKKSAEQGNTKAQVSLGTMNQQGQGVSKNNKEAIKWFKLAAENGESMAQIKLGMMYYDGLGVAKNYKEAAKWFLRAAEQGDPAAQVFLGRLSMEGKGVTRNYIQALKWLTIAEENGNKIARKIKDLLLKKLPPEHVSEAQLLANEWINSHKRVVDHGTFKKYESTVGVFPKEYLEFSQEEKEAYVRGSMDGGYIFLNESKNREYKIIVTCLNTKLKNIISVASQFKKSNMKHYNLLMPWTLSTLMGQLCDKNPVEGYPEYKSGTVGWDLVELSRKSEDKTKKSWEEASNKISKAYIRGAIDGGVFYLHGHFYPKLNKYLDCLSEPKTLERVINMFHIIPVTGGELSSKDIQALLVLDAQRYVCKEVFK